MLETSNARLCDEPKQQQSETRYLVSCKIGCRRRREETQIKTDKEKFESHYLASYEQKGFALPIALERDTLLMPDAIAESVVQEAERFLKAELPEDFAPRLATRAHYLYPRHTHFHKMLNRAGNRGRDNLYMYMRHWTCSWLKRERYAFFKRLPWSYAHGSPLPIS